MKMHQHFVIWKHLGGIEVLRWQKENTFQLIEDYNQTSFPLAEQPFGQKH
jgi:hypothetical protein